MDDLAKRVASRHLARALAPQVETRLTVEHVYTGPAGSKVDEVVTDYTSSFDGQQWRYIEWDLVLDLAHLGATAEYHFPIASGEHARTMAAMLLRVAERIDAAEARGGYKWVGTQADARPLRAPEVPVMNGKSTRPGEPDPLPTVVKSWA